ncbi:MAG: heavy-metal-associated domain-containing protein [Phycisphaeraceae bacterium]
MTPIKTVMAALTPALFFVMLGCQAAGSAERPPLDPEQADAEVQVAGMSCPQCANNIKDIMERVDGVEQARVDLGAGRVLIAFRQGATVGEDAIVLAVKDSGFTPGEVTYKNGGGQ